MDGSAIENMALDVRAGYDLAAAAPGVAGVNGVGEAWSRAMANGIADPNPYDGIDLDKVDLGATTITTRVTTATIWKLWWCLAISLAWIHVPWA